MIVHTEAYDKAVTASSRRMFARAVFDLVDPDAQTTAVTVSNESEISLKDQVVNRGHGSSDQRIATLELDRWALDGSFVIPPENPADRSGQVGWESADLCGSDGVFALPYPYIELTIANVSILQAVTLEFSNDSLDGHPVDFTVAMWSGATLLKTVEVTGNEGEYVVIGDFTVDNPTKIRLTVKNTSLGFVRAKNLMCSVKHFHCE